eukprot:CAMPEP_0174891312 /NCGR_PEP_ID=MMETSP0167-20121228/6383_1 /TAXON_ID=38298 /ORGANISM="Rhodella maculata, Strain CCMP736" /LENGTH=188 /DNA_ID=CAMNT_0016129421 /DNA_START=475 /DNA_END=1038 /DNA_ORIENTATION=-
MIDARSRLRSFGQPLQNKQRSANLHIPRRQRRRIQSFRSPRALQEGPGQLTPTLKPPGNTLGLPCVHVFNLSPPSLVKVKKLSRDAQPQKYLLQAWHHHSSVSSPPKNASQATQSKSGWRQGAGRGPLRIVMARIGLGSSSRVSRVIIGDAGGSLGSGSAEHFPSIKIKREAAPAPGTGPTASSLGLG